jgi:hypothetical protein
MTHRLDIFSPETYQRFSDSDRRIAAIKGRYRKLASEVEPGDWLLAYITKLSRWCGVLEVTSKAFEDSTPRFADSDDPYVLRFQVRPDVWLTPEHALPIHHDEVWTRLSFTKGHGKDSSLWTGNLRRSLVELNDDDGRVLVELLRRQDRERRVHPLDQHEQRLIAGHQVRRADGAVSVTVPDDTDDGAAQTSDSKKEVRESIKVQALLARIGAAMKMKVWIPANDRGAVVKELGPETAALLDTLPLNYDNTTIDTIERIDVLWIKGRSIVRAFEVEHTTSIYSGILRMADLLSLQPNMDIRLHLVAPEERRTKVMNEIRRPVFSYLERRPLSKSCTFLSYDAVHELAALPHLGHLSDSILSEYEEIADE